jgi:hypothetical protein
LEKFFLSLWVCFAGNDSDSATFHSHGFEKHTHLLSTAGNSGDLFNLNGGLSQTLGWMVTKVCFDTLLMLFELALGSIERQFFELFNTTRLFWVQVDKFF